jgi:hypothetical protein
MGLIPTRSHTPSSPACKHNALNQKSINLVLRIRIRNFFGPPGSASFLSSSDPARYGTCPNPIPHSLLACMQAQHFKSELHQYSVADPAPDVFWASRIRINLFWHLLTRKRYRIFPDPIPHSLLACMQAQTLYIINPSIKFYGTRFLKHILSKDAYPSVSVNPYVFGPPGSGSGSVCQRYKSGSGPFYQANERKNLSSYCLYCLYCLVFCHFFTTLYLIKMMKM